QYVQLIENVGIVTSIKQRNFGLYDFKGKILVENKYDYFKYDKSSPNIIEFREFPYSKSSYSDYYKNIIVDEYYYDYNDSVRKESTFKAHLYDVKSRNFNILSSIKNRKNNTEYFFLSDENFKYKELYIICGRRSVVLA